MYKERKNAELTFFQYCVYKAVRNISYNTVLTAVEICDPLEIYVSECIVLLYGLLFTVLKIVLLIQLNIVWITLFTLVPFFHTDYSKLISIRK